jgi:DNA replication protein DnaC
MTEEIKICVFLNKAELEILVTLCSKEAQVNECFDTRLTEKLVDRLTCISRDRIYDFRNPANYE